MPLPVSGGGIRRLRGAQSWDAAVLGRRGEIREIVHSGHLGCATLTDDVVRRCTATAFRRREGRLVRGSGRIGRKCAALVGATALTWGLLAGPAVAQSDEQLRGRVLTSAVPLPGYEISLFATSA